MDADALELKVQILDKGMTSVVSFLPADHSLQPADAMAVGMKSGGLSQLCDLMGQPQGILTSSGRESIGIVLQALHLARGDEVWILTSFDFSNVSSCVTSTVFNVCKPSRVATKNTRAILIIHEFGIPHPETPKIAETAKQRGIPLIEDCAHTIDSRRDGWQVGTHGDYAIVSFPKMFPAAGGGALLGGDLDRMNSVLNAPESKELDQKLAYWLSTWPEQAERRRDVYQNLTRRFQEIGLQPLFTVTDQVTPWFFPVYTPRHREMVAAARAKGVDCGLWHGTEIVVFPCHQYLTSECLARICSVAAEVHPQTSN